jgi:transcription-repair coupling factor (superfamily II helicase)
MILEQLDEIFSPTQEFSPAQIRRSQERQKAAKMLQDQIKQAEAQQGRLADFLEQGIYSIDDFISRRNVLSERLAKLRSQLAEVIEPDAAQERLAELRKLVPRSMTISEAYRQAPDAATKNELLHALIESVDYDKTERMHSRHDDPRRGVVLDIKPRS